MEKTESKPSYDIGEEIILLLKEINARLDNIIKKQNEKKLQTALMDGNRT